MRHPILALGLACLAVPGCSGADYAPLTSPPPSMAPVSRAMPEPSAPDYAPDQGFAQWLSGLRIRALSQGINPAVFDQSLAGVGYQPSIIRLDQNQSEFTKTVWDYLDGAVSADRIAQGQAKIAANAQILDAIERRYGVPREVVVAVWGMESNYGANRGRTEVIPALATLAYDGRRGAFFEGELMAALRIVQAGDVPAHYMTGSWAGAMGHTQFMPSSFLAHAVDFNRDGRRDIWSDDPTDALASTASYLAQSGWRSGQPWAVEVRLPVNFDMRLSGRATSRQSRDWQGMGVRTVSGSGLPDLDRASILLPAGARGPAFLVGANFGAIRTYNASDSYVLGVGLLSDRLAGRPGLQGQWPRGDRSLSPDERREMQELLTRRGYDTQGTDGKIGPNTVEALRAWQAANGLMADGYPTPAMLARLRG
ncbi:lytic murein transglycosylase [Frigidibacter sp. MR17.24]|uniref:lytic murein transglycosylase n=1 Tax=Frigidibacter sp. MR17.24 TaxID=3127345 RepID=UPI003012C885